MSSDLFFLLIFSSPLPPPGSCFTWDPKHVEEMEAAAAAGAPATEEEGEEGEEGSGGAEEGSGRAEDYEVSYSEDPSF